MKNWKTFKIGQIAVVANGKTPSRNEQKDEGLPILKIKDITSDGRYKGVCSTYVAESFYTSYNHKALKKGDTLFLNAAHNSDYVGSKNYFATAEVEGIIPTGEWLVVSGNKELVHPQFLYFYLTSPIGLTFIKDIVKGIHLYPKDVARIPIFLPQISEQQRIAHIIAQADLLRQQDRQLLAHYDALIQAVFVELFGDQNPAAAKWPEKTIAELARTTKNSMRTGPFGSDLLHSEFVEEGTFVLGIDNVVNNRFEWAKPRFITGEKYEKLKRYTVYPGDVLISIMGTIGRTAVVPDNIPAAINSKHLAAITLNQNLALPTFVSYSLYADPRIVRQLSARSKGAIMDGLNLGIIKDTKLLLPPLPLQQKFAAIVAQIEQQKAAVQQQQAHSEALFQSLLQQAFRGELGGALAD